MSVPSDQSNYDSWKTRSDRDEYDGGYDPDPEPTPEEERIEDQEPKQCMGCGKTPEVEAIESKSRFTVRVRCAACDIVVNGTDREDAVGYWNKYYGDSLESFYSPLDSVHDKADGKGCS